MANPQLSPLAERVGHSPQLTGRAVAALAGDPAIIDKTGQSIDVRDVALAYGSLTSMAHCQRPARAALSPTIPPIQRPLEHGQYAGRHEFINAYGWRMHPSLTASLAMPDSACRPRYSAHASFEERRGPIGACGVRG